MRAKPNYEKGNQTYANDDLIQNVIKTLVAQGIVNSEAATGLRNDIHPDVFKKQEFWDAIHTALRLPSQAIVRLPRVIESNVMGQGQGFHDTNTYEWCEEYLQSGERLISGSSDYGGASRVGLGDAANALIGFRPLVVFPQS